MPNSHPAEGSINTINGLERAKQLGVIFLVALLAIGAWVKPLEAPASQTLDATMKKAFVTFATARALTARRSTASSSPLPWH